MTQALQPNFDRWLKDRGLQHVTLLALRKESILNDTTLRLLTESDLEVLKKQYKISLGQFALLRNARDDLTSAVAEDFEVIEFADVPEGPSHGRSSTGGQADSAGRGQQSTSGLLQQNLKKGQQRGQKLSQTAESAERVASAASEFSDLSAALAEKIRKESRKGRRVSSEVKLPDGESGAVKQYEAHSQPHISHYDRLEPRRDELMQHQTDSAEQTEAVTYKAKKCCSVM